MVTEEPSTLLPVVYSLFLALSALCAILQFWAHRIRKDDEIGNNPQFLKFQRGYFVVYLVAMFADWLQGPYLYKLYSYYGFQEEQIATLYVFGFASTVILGTWTPIAADKFGRKKLCLVFTITYSISCLMKLSRSYGILLIGRILGGVATSVLFSAFEAWYVHEHIETHDFPKEWISVTFAKASFWNGLLAVLAGMTTNIFSEWFGMGPVVPYMMAVPFLIFVGFIISTHWNENYSAHKINFTKSCCEGMRNILSSEKIFMIGAIESLFESVIYIVIFLWTPILDTGHSALGLVFASFMVCILIGQAVFHVLTSRKIPVVILLLSATGTAMIANIICVFSSHPQKRAITASYLAFLLFQFSVGIYFPSMGYLRNRIIPENYRYSIMNWFRIPLNLISCVVLMLLHEDAFRHGNRMIFVICVILLFLALVSGLRFLKLSKNDSELKEDVYMMESEHIHNIF